MINTEFSREHILEAIREQEFSETRPSPRERARFDGPSRSWKIVDHRSTSPIYSLFRLFLMIPGTPVHSFQKTPSGVLRENKKQLGRPETDLLTVFVVVKTAY